MTFKNEIRQKCFWISCTFSQVNPSPINCAFACIYAHAYMCAYARLYVAYMTQTYDTKNAVLTCKK